MGQELANTMANVDWCMHNSNCAQVTSKACTPSITFYSQQPTKDCQ